MGRERLGGREVADLADVVYLAVSCAEYGFGWCRHECLLVAT